MYTLNFKRFVVYQIKKKYLFEKRFKDNLIFSNYGKIFWDNKIQKINST